MSNLAAILLLGAILVAESKPQLWLPYPETFVPAFNPVPVIVKQNSNDQKGLNQELAPIIGAVAEPVASETATVKVANEKDEVQNGSPENNKSNGGLFGKYAGELEIPFLGSLVSGLQGGVALKPRSRTGVQISQKIASPRLLLDDENEPEEEEEEENEEAIDEYIVPVKEEILLPEPIPKSGLYAFQDYRFPSIADFANSYFSGNGYLDFLEPDRKYCSCSQS